MATTIPPAQPRLIVVLSGKRKSGKDFTAERLIAEYAHVSPLSMDMLD
jgi:hypothetical protein